jgi:hypothetical protein
MQHKTVGLFSDLPIRPLTRRLVERLLFDLPLSPAMMVDFGITAAAHYRALRHALCAAQVEVEADAHDEGDGLCGLRKRIVELDRALGHGPRLTAFVRKYAPHTADPVRFHTAWDTLYGRSNRKKP